MNGSSRLAGRMLRVKKAAPFGYMTRGKRAYFRLGVLEKGKWG